MSVVQPSQIQPGTSLVIGSHISVRDDECIVKEVVRTGEGMRVRVQYVGSGVSETIEVPAAAEKARTPPAAPVRHAAPAARAAASPDIKSFEQLADSMLASMRQYCDAKVNARFVDVIRHLPSGREYEERLISEVSREIQKMIEAHQSAIKDDVEYLRAALTRLDSVEARLKLLENPNAYQSAVA